MEIGQKVARTFGPGEIGALEHPRGACVAVEKDSPLEQETEISLVPVDAESLALAANAFRISVTRRSKAQLHVSLPLDLSGLKPAQNDEILPFIEMRDHLGSFMIAATMSQQAERPELKNVELRRLDEATRAHATIDLVRDHHVAVVGAGAVVVPVGSIPSVFHPVQHHFKMNEERLQAFAPAPGVGGLGPCRRARSADANGVPCMLPSPPSLYPACYPAAWAILCGAHRTTPTAPRRRWESGTPLDANPPPRAWGDPLSTWAMGDPDVGATPPPVARVEDWRAEASDPTPERVRVSALPRFLLDGSGTLDEQIARRAKLIKTFLVRIVGGGDSGSMTLLGLDPPRPAKIGHNGHAWVVVGVEPDGYWSHAQNNDAWGFTDFTAWDEATWAAPKAVLNEHDKPWYEIHYLPDTELKPEERRLGCMAFMESSDVGRRTGFYEVEFPVPFDDADGAPVETVLWTPRTRAAETGYSWIESNTPLTREGLPTLRDADLWDPVFGRVLPRPSRRRAECACGLAHGCASCRLRMQLHFWILNTTRDERVAYRVDLEVWSREERWIEIPVQVVGGAGRPAPGEIFEIVAAPDLAPTSAGGTALHTAPGRQGPWNGQAMQWWLDLDRDLLGVNHVHGVRLTLSCVRRGDQPICRVQDVKQLWFRAREHLY